MPLARWAKCRWRNLPVIDLAPANILALPCMVSLDHQFVSAFSHHNLPYHCLLLVSARLIIRVVGTCTPWNKSLSLDGVILKVCQWMMLGGCFLIIMKGTLNCGNPSRMMMSHLYSFQHDLSVLFYDFPKLLDFWCLVFVYFLTYVFGLVWRLLLLTAHCYIAFLFGIIPISSDFRPFLVL